MKSSGILFDIEHGSFVDGPGVRTVVFFKGCNLRCAWCHNPESQRFDPEMLLYHDKCTGCGKCRAVCPSPDGCTLCGKCALLCPHDARKISGRAYTADEVMEDILSDLPFYENTGGGVTFSGGECLLQPDFLEELLRRCREAGIHTAVDTAGHVPWETFERVLPYTDLFLYDVKLFDSERHRAYTGVGNERILDNLARLGLHGARIWIRMPVMAGVNDDEAAFAALCDWLSSHVHPERVEVLAYHTLGEHKYAALNRELTRFSPPEAEILARLREMAAGCTF